MPYFQIVRPSGGQWRGTLEYVAAASYAAALDVADRVCAERFDGGGFDLRPVRSVPTSVFGVPTHTTRDTLPELLAAVAIEPARGIFTVSRDNRVLALCRTYAEACDVRSTLNAMARRIACSHRLMTIRARLHFARKAVAV